MSINQMYQVLRSSSLLCLIYSYIANRLWWESSLPTKATTRGSKLCLILRGFWGQSTHWCWPGWARQSVSPDRSLPVTLKWVLNLLFLFRKRRTWLLYCGMIYSCTKEDVVISKAAVRNLRSETTSLSIRSNCSTMLHPLHGFWQPCTILWNVSVSLFHQYTLTLL